MVTTHLKRSAAVLSFIAAMAFSVPVFAQPDMKMEKAPAMEGMPAMDPEMQAKMKEYSTPNENHKVLDQIVGSWDYSMKMWMDPAASPEETTGSNEAKWIMGGRFVEQNVTGTAMGQPFEGHGMIGYDNLKKEYNSVWIDNMGTGMMTSSGQYDAATKTFSDKGNFSCPLRGETAYRAETKIVDENTYIYTWYTPDLKTGQEMKSMEITFKRKK